MSSIAKGMDSLAASPPEYLVVMSFFGVDPVLCSQLIAEIGDVSCFPNKKDLVRFADIDASPFQSGSIYCARVAEHLNALNCAA